jgi:anti-sigma factor RsiW
MDCNEFVELVTAFLEGTLDPDTEERFVEHLTQCPGCDVYLDQFRQTIDALGELPVESLSTEARNRMLEVFRDWRRPA